MSLFNKIKSIFHSEGESQATEKTNDFNPTDDLMLDTFIYGEAEYRHQSVRMVRREFGEKAFLGDVLDALAGEKVSDGVTRLSVCFLNINHTRPENTTVDYNDSEIIRKLDVISLLNQTGEDGSLHAVAGENVILTVLYKDGHSTVLHVRNMQSTPYMGYIKVISMANSNHTDNASQIFRPDMPIFHSTLLAFRKNREDIHQRMSYYDQVEKETWELVKNSQELPDQFHREVYHGIYRQKTFAEYPGYANWLLSEKRPYDALRQYLRLLNMCDNPGENLKHGDIYGEWVHGMALALFSTVDPVREFHYLDLACFFSQNWSKEWLFLLSMLADYRVPGIIDNNTDKIPLDIQNTLKGLHEEAKNSYAEKAKNDPSTPTMGFILSQLLRIRSNNIFSMIICRNTSDGYKHEYLDDREKIWTYRLSDALGDGNTIAFSYSRFGQQCGLEDDKSMLCPDNSVIMHVNKVPGSELFRIDMMVPPFVFDSDRLNAKEDDIPDFRTFIVSATPYEYDFSKPSTEIYDKATELYGSDKCALEAMVGYIHVYRALLPQMQSLDKDERTNCICSAGQLGSCFLEMQMPDVAEYYLKIGAEVGFLVGEYLNCLTNQKDPRTLDILNKYLLSTEIVIGTNLQESRAFLRRRITYVLINWGEIDKAEEMLKGLLNDPLCSQFAQHELEYISNLKNHH
jgi:hypothetical protein